MCFEFTLTKQILECTFKQCIIYYRARTISESTSVLKKGTSITTAINMKAYLLFPTWKGKFLRFKSYSPILYFLKGPVPSCGGSSGSHGLGNRSGWLQRNLRTWTIPTDERAQFDHQSRKRSRGMSIRRWWPDFVCVCLLLD